MAARDRVRARANNAGGGGAVVAERPSTLPPVIQMLTDPRTKGEFAKGLPAGADVDRYLRVARTAVQANPDLLRCEPRSIIAAIHKAAAYGLDVGPIGQAYLTPFGATAQLIIGYRGMLALARRSGELVSIEAREVKENDEFEYQYGMEPILKHIPALKDRGELVCFYGLAHFRNGGMYMLIVDLDTVEEHRKQSKTGAQMKGPWKDHYEAMGRKTVVRMMEPYLPLTTEAGEAFVTDDVAPDSSVDYIDVAYDEVDVVEEAAPVDASGSVDAPGESSA